MQVKEYYQDPVNGNVEIEFSNGDQKNYNLQEVAVVKTDSNGVATGLIGPQGKDFLVISALLPVDADGRPDGTIYIQTAA